MIRRSIVAVFLFAVLGAGHGFGQTIVDPTTHLQVELVASGLSSPTSMAFIGDDDILVLQKGDGLVRRIQGGILLSAPVLDVAVHFRSERGLLGVATDPDFINNGYVYLYYTESSTGDDTSSSTSTPLGNRVYRHTWSGTALVDPVLILDLPVTTGPNHDGGIVVFGPDDALYAVIGDLNRDGKLENFPTGPDPDDTGVVFRVHRSGRPLVDNPFFDAANLDNPMNRYFAYGIRNSFGMAFDPVSGDLWDSENGPSSFDEVNRVVPGFNSGWEQIMGPDARDPQNEADLWIADGSVYRDPEFSWADPVAPAAVGFVASRVLGCELEHDLIVGDNNCGQLYRFAPAPGRETLEFTSPELQDKVADNAPQRCSDELGELLLGSNWGVVTDIENGPDGRLYVVSLTLGSVYRIAPASGSFPDTDGDGVDDACDCATELATSYAPPVELPQLRISATAPTTLGWDGQSGTAGPGTTYDLVSGDLTSLRVQAGFASACSLTAGTPTPASEDSRPDPPPGRGHYYLARAANDCDSGTFGEGSGIPDPRDELDVSIPPACACTQRSGGAFVRFDIVEETLTIWTTDDAFVDEAIAQLGGGPVRVPIFALLDGRECDPQWTWHTDPAIVSFADATIEVCDSLPSFVEADKDHWLNTVGEFCPWAAIVQTVDDRR